jgi:hypothetical protein
MAPTGPLFPSDRPLRAAWIGACAAGIVFLAGCATTSDRRDTPSPPPQLLSSAALDMPQDCAPPRGAIYRTRFVVQPDGGVAEATSESGDGCVQQALREWVSSFRYTPVADATPMVIDWIEVTASRGG